MDSGENNMVDDSHSLASSGASAGKRAMANLSSSSSSSPSSDGELSDVIAVESFQGLCLCRGKPYLLEVAVIVVIDNMGCASIGGSPSC